MAPGTKRIAIGGLVLALVAWAAIDAYLPEELPPAPEPRSAEGLKPIAERETPKRKDTSVAKPCVPGTPASQGKVESPAAPQTKDCGGH